MNENSDYIDVERGPRTQEPEPSGVSWRMKSAEHDRFLSTSEIGSSRVKSFIHRVARTFLYKLGYELVPLKLHSESDLAFKAIQYSNEAHHHDYGRPWCLGADQFDYLVTRGLSVDHRFLDVGCGALRTGIWLIDYLDPNCYYGVDAHRGSLEAAAKYEVPFNRLASKSPRLLHSDCFELGYWNLQYDWILAFALIQHLSPNNQDIALKTMASVLKPSGRIVVTGLVPFDDDELRSLFGLEVVHREKRKSVMLPDEISWVELMKISV